MRLLREIHNLMGNYHVKSGLYHYHRNEYKQAVEFFLKALKDEDKLTRSDRRNARHHLTLALMESAAQLEAADDREGCVGQLRRASEFSPSFPDIHYRLGQMLESLGRWSEAVEEFNLALQCHPGYVDAQVALGFCLLRAGMVEESRRAFGRALELRKERLDARFAEAAALLDRGDARAAEDRFHETFLSSPSQCRQHMRRAMDWLRDDDHEKSMVELDAALDLSPGYPDLHNLRGVVLCELDRIDEAIEAFRTASRLSPNFMAPRLNVAFAMLRAEDYRAAERELESILRLDPTEPAATAKLEELRSGRLPDKRRPVTRGNAR